MSGFPEEVPADPASAYSAREYPVWNTGPSPGFGPHQRCSRLTGNRQKEWVVCVDMSWQRRINKALVRFTGFQVNRVGNQGTPTRSSAPAKAARSEEHTSELQSRENL